MRQFGLAVIMVAALGAGAMMTSAAQAAPAGGLDNAASGLGLVEQTQFIIGGRNYCWYDGGWHGPGWYWCGYAYRSGYGWGGPVGFHGWAHGGRGRFRGGRRGGSSHGGHHHH
jgi:hypothetical protein